MEMDIALHTALLLLISHAIGDLALQTKYIAENKCYNTLTGRFALIGHCVIVAGVTYLLIPISWVFFLRFFTHLIIDHTSSRSKNRKRLLYDQILHFTVLGVIWWHLI